MKNEEKSKKEYLRSIHIDQIELSTLRKNLKLIIPFPLYLNDAIKFIGRPHGVRSLDVLSRMNDANTWVKKCNYLFEGISKSFLIAVDFIDQNEKLFVPFRITQDDRTVYYFIENGIYRLFSLWDTLAHLYHFYYELDFETEKIHYFQIFNLDYKRTFMGKVQCKIDEIVTKPNDNCVYFIEQKFIEICHYIRQKNEYVNGQWTGNHRYLKNIRNQFTHRDNPHDFSSLNYAQQGVMMPDAPLLELKRAIDDYLTVYEYICNVWKLITSELAKQGIWFDTDIKKYNPMQKLLDDLK
ncbi:hypothetical protein HP570_21475 [Brevibacillus sp. RS1.1]|uniref:Cthe_2314 family HEPN domain-containing protein n=1 Tax=Brevibacillus sp. RS1.1 TaxID=2738982 RepID=UPI00156AB2EA|nr:Cthe_2314 family HEPN domain-containing protein [Brevibacillus sp. RS1.1]NRR04788.1 hypothetical protein [Brevibacillus sp. RS1.1]